MKIKGQQNLEILLVLLLIIFSSSLFFLGLGKSQEDFKATFLFKQAAINFAQENNNSLMKLKTYVFGRIFNAKVYFEKPLSDSELSLLQQKASNAILGATSFEKVEVKQ
jgi:hypothetical protein